MNAANPVNNQEPQMQRVPARRAFIPRGMANRAQVITERALDSVCAPVNATLQSARRNVPEIVENARAVANAGVNFAVAAGFPDVPAPLRNMAINEALNLGQPVAENAAHAVINGAETCAVSTKESTKNIANRIINSDSCYGDGDSCVSRMTTRFIGN